MMMKTDEQANNRMNDKKINFTKYRSGHFTFCALSPIRPPTKYALIWKEVSIIDVPCDVQGSTWLN